MSVLILLMFCYSVSKDWFWGDSEMASAIVRRNITNNLKRLPFLSSCRLKKQHLFNVEDGTVSIHTDAVLGVGLPSYMRGAVYREPNKPLTIEEFHIPRPKAGELLIKTKGTVPFIFPTTFFFKSFIGSYFCMI